MFGDEVLSSVGLVCDLGLLLDKELSYNDQVSDFRDGTENHPSQLYVRVVTKCKYVNHVVNPCIQIDRCSVRNMQRENKARKIIELCNSDIAKLTVK